MSFHKKLHGMYGSLSFVRTVNIEG